ncbi:MAG: radical SAM protein [Candidatus Omnitrophica bacterium]|nr:radical SAM protein [Candidatus Omnitrophota bacterium]
MFKVRFLKKRIPLAVRLQVTNRCTLQCKYCNLWNTKTEEFTKEEIFSLIDQLAVLGAKRISFSGGEPLLRKDIGEIISYCREKSIYPEMNSNGTLVPERVDEISNLDFLKLSLDGPKEIHDLLRGKGSYGQVLAAADSVSKKGMNFGFATTLTKYNIDHLDFLLAIAEKYNTIVAFQPLKQLYRGISDISNLAPSQDKFKKAIDKLIQTKKSGNRHMRNSLRGLKHIYNWPKYKKLRCWSGRLFCIINADGELFPCDRINYNSPLPNCKKQALKLALDQLPQAHCSGCGFCGSLELNYLMNFKLDIISSIRKILDKQE